jgi:hypothetical protein
MKIREVKTYRLDAALAEPFAYSPRGTDGGDRRGRRAERLGRGVWARDYELGHLRLRLTS